MGTMQIRAGLFLTLLVITSHGVPRGQRTINFVGEGTNELATAILQGYVNNESNLAFSPIGYSTLLAILAEGASGETRKQLENALRLPKERQEIRSAYHTVLERLKEKNVLNKPELRNWFYVYENFTVEQSYRDILRENYLTEVKSVERPGNDIGFQLSHDSMAEPMPDQKPMKEEIGNDKTVEDPMNQDSVKKEEEENDDTKSWLEESLSLGGMKEGALIEQAIQEDSTRTESVLEAQTEREPIAEEKPMEGEDEMKDESKTTGGVQDTRQNEPMEEAEKDTNEEMKENENPLPESEPVPTEELKSEETPMEENNKPMEEEKPMKETTPIAEEEQEEMETSETKHVQHRALMDSQDITSSLSGNNLVSKAANGSMSQMIVFNGMHFNGSWAVPFEKKGIPETFYKSNSEKKAVTMIRALGKFSIGSISELDSTAIELPYEGGRYSLLVLVPSDRGGLSELIASLTGYSLLEINAQLVQRDVEVLLPCFTVETITKPIKALGKFGVTDVFSAKDAELPGISKDSGLYVQELVQLVMVRVDDSSTRTNHLTSSSVEPRSGGDDKIVEKIIVDRPFLYFVRDTRENLVVVAGKVEDPTLEPSSKFD